jgi:hypothetical protein
MDLTKIGWMHQSPVPSFVRQQEPYQYKPLPSQLLTVQEGMDEHDSDATFLTTADDVSLKTTTCLVS